MAQPRLKRIAGPPSPVAYYRVVDKTLSETDRINLDILDVSTLDWGVEVTLVELKDIQLPESMKREMARQA